MKTDGKEGSSLSHLSPLNIMFLKHTFTCTKTKKYLHKLKREHLTVQRNKRINPKTTEELLSSHIPLSRSLWIVPLLRQTKATSGLHSWCAAGQLCLVKKGEVWLQDRCAWYSKVKFGWETLSWNRRMFFEISLGIVWCCGRTSLIYNI